MKYVVDTSLINKLVDGSVHADDLPKNGDLIATHVQKDEIKRTKNIERQKLLSSTFDKIIDYSLPTESSILDHSPLDEDKLNEDESYNAIKADLDSRNGGKNSNIQDA